MLFNNSRISILQNKKKRKYIKAYRNLFIYSSEEKREEIYGLDNCSYYSLQRKLQINRINCLL